MSKSPSSWATAPKLAQFVLPLLTVNNGWDYFLGGWLPLVLIAVLAVHVADGQQVDAGATLLVVEAMKMEHPVVAPTAGTVTAVHVGVGDGVDAGTALLAFEPDGA